MKFLTYLVNIAFWMIPTIFCLIVFFPLALIPVIGMATSHSRLNSIYDKKDADRRHNEMMDLMRQQNRFL
ncbi:MAG: hypothetical protein GY880_24930 [Planctomycetaceae bacterium]|nr:hypothetical protein [Planctomycetaceae bacterium]